jgi:hypothetical protein
VHNNLRHRYAVTVKGEPQESYTTYN